MWIKVVSLQNQRLCTVNRWNFEIAVVFWFFLCEKDLRPKSYRKLLVRGKIWDSTVIVQFANLPYVAKKKTKTTKKNSFAFSKQFSPKSKTHRLFGKSCLFVSKCLSSSRKARMASSGSWLRLCWMLCFFASDKELKNFFCNSVHQEKENDQFLLHFDFHAKPRSKPWKVVGHLQ